jgi:hypothetical protein
MDVRSRAVGVATLCAAGGAVADPTQGKLPTHPTAAALAAPPAATLDSTPSWTLRGGPAGFGWRSGILDANGDGFDDVVVGASGLGGMGAAR